ncbi:MAG: amidohydrolase family protein [Acidimicrobiia bacterium]|nr:amidohydrolase family protein [Acidimicrobiia bacterium]
MSTDPVSAPPSEPIVEADLPICDAHHHLWLGRGHTGTPYTLADLHADTATGHNIVRTVFVECHAEYRREGPEHLRPVGEVEFVAAAAEASVDAIGPEIEGIVGHADLTLGAAVDEVLEELTIAGRGRFRGIRFTTAWDPAPMGNNAARGGIMGEPEFREGLAALGRRGLSFDAMVFHTQIGELADLARARPEVTIVANHLCVPIAGGPYRGRADEVRALWRRELPGLAACENVVLKIGALIRPLSGERWDKRGRGASSDEIVAAWGDEIRFAVDTFGPARCLFESNFPVDKACFGYVEVWNAFKKLSAGFGAGEKLDLFHDTAARAYRLPLLAS